MLFAAAPCLLSEEIRVQKYKIEIGSWGSEVLVYFELPEPGQGTAVQNLRNNLIRMLDSIISMDLLDNEVIFKGNKDDTDALIACYQDYLLKHKAEILENGLYSYLSTELRKETETGNLIIFRGGGGTMQEGMAHPGEEYTYFVTFDKRTGEQCLTPFLRSDIPFFEFLALLKKSDEGFLENDDLGLISYDPIKEMPSLNPDIFPSEGGLVLTYDGNELGLPRYMGDPRIVVPYSDILPLMTPEARSLLFDYPDVTEELSDIALTLCQYIPDHGLAENAQPYLTTSYYQAYSRAYNIPSDGIGDNEWLYYFVTGNDCTLPCFTVKSVHQIDNTHAIADIVVRELFVRENYKCLYEEKKWHTITMVKENGRWLLDDFDASKAGCNYLIDSEL